jgi:hypothetical protein
MPEIASKRRFRHIGQKPAFEACHPSADRRRPSERGILERCLDALQQLKLVLDRKHSGKR